MSVMCLEASDVSGSESKRYKMKQFIDAAKEYSQSKTENSAMIINRLLQALSVTIDLSMFDPTTTVVSEFFVSLHELLTHLEPRSTIAWNCVEVLSNACRNPGTRNVLIHTYQFLSPLARLVGDQLTQEKKVKLLTLMQELTCGIKISWQIPHLPHLMTTLTKWVESKNEKVVTLSLGVLVNLCYKNLPAIYTLTRCVDMKKFVKTCMPLQGTEIEVHVCKLLIILDYLNGKVPESTILKLIKVTFKTMIEAFKASDSILLRHIVEFFLDVLKQGSQADVIASYQYYDQEIEKLLSAVENNIYPTELHKSYDPECLSLFFEFLHTIIDLKFTELTPLLPKILQIALKWIQTDIACTQALSVLRTIAINTPSENANILEPLHSGIPIFVLMLNHGAEESSGNLEQQKRVGALLQLIKTLLQVDGLRERMLEELNEIPLRKLFVPVLDGNSTMASGDDSIYSADTVNLFAFAMGLIDDLAKLQPSWISLYCSLMQQKQIHMILAQALYNGPKFVKKVVMEMAGSRMFPTDSITEAMGDMQHVIQTEAPSKNNDQIANNMCFPAMSVTKIQRLDDIIQELKEAIDLKKFSNIPTSNVMELYEYKLAAMGHAERAAMASVDAASQRCVYLQHRTAQLTAELSRLHQLLFHTQQCHEEAVKNRNMLTENNKELENKLIIERGRYKACCSQLKTKEAEFSSKLAEMEQALDETSKKLKEVSTEKQNLEERNAELKAIVAKLEENLTKKERVLEKKEEIISKANTTIENLRTQKGDLEKQLAHSESKLITLNREYEVVSKELECKRKILNTITQVANSEM